MHESGGPLTIVAMETATSSERINHACREAYAEMQRAFAEQMQPQGYAADRAEALASFLTSAIEGGIILSRTFDTGDPLRRVAEEGPRSFKNNVQCKISAKNGDGGPTAPPSPPFFGIQFMRSNV